ncbi:11621_t:CDS:1, partial [Gigaspora rosea]
LSTEINLATQELESNVQEYIYIINQPTVTKDVLIDKSIVEVVIDKFCEDNDNNDDDKKLLPLPITITKAIEELEKL